MSQDSSRRAFLKNSALATAGIAALSQAEARAQEETPKTVPRRVLGNTGEEIPILVLGCAQKFDAKYDKILHRAHKEGVNYLDTALVYANGQSHKTIAPFLKQIGDRKETWITSKAPHRSNGATPKTYNTDLDTCLKQLETDYVDLFFMHGLDNVKYVSKEYTQMGDKMKKSGKIRFFGFSCHDGNVVELMNQAAKVGGIDAIMFRFNYARYGDKALHDAIDNCAKAGIGLIAMKTQNSIPEKLEQVVKFQEKNLNLPQAKLKYVWEDERIAAAVSHINNLQKLEENVAAAKSKVKLTHHQKESLHRLADITAPLSCVGCKQHCEPKVQGALKIADPLRYLMYAECYGETEKAREMYRALSPEERELRGVDLAEATKACPAGIDIEARLYQARRVLT